MSELENLKELRRRVSLAERDLAAANEQIAARDEYIKLLGEEIDEIAGIVHVHGWRSSRGEAGKACRNRIKQADVTVEAIQKENP